MRHGTGNDKHDDDRWATFISKLPTAWLPVATAFSEASGVVEGKVDDDGTWTIDLMYGLSDLRTLVRAAPVEFVSVASGQSWWLDQHLEDEGGVVVAKAARAIVSWSDNFASGMNATLNVYTSDGAYQSAVDEARARHEETYDEDAEPA